MTAEIKERWFEGGVAVASGSLAVYLAHLAGLDPKDTTLLKDLITVGGGMVGNYLAQFSSETFMPIVKEKWLKNSNPKINHHLQRALFSALKDALADVQAGYEPEDGTDDPDAIREFLAVMVTKGDVAFMDAVSEEFNSAEIQRYATASAETIAPLLAHRLDVLGFANAAEGYVSPRFLAFFREKLPERFRFHFREALKDQESPEAKAALDLLFQETVLAALERLPKDSETRRQEVETLYQQAQQTHQQVEFYGEIWLSALRQVRDQLARIETNTERALEKLDSLGTDVSAIKEKIANLPPSAVVPDFVASERFQQLTADVQRLRTEFETTRQKKEKVARTAATLDGEAAELLHEQADLLTVTLLRLDGERQTQEQALTRFVNDVLRLAETLGTNPATASERLQRARALFEAGQFAEADAVLNEADLRADKARLHAHSRDLAQEFLVKANLTALNKDENPDWFAQARGYYLDAVETFEGYDTTCATAYFLQSCNQFGEAFIFYEKAERFSTTNEQRALVLNNLGVLQKANNRMDEAEESYREALETYRQLALTNPAAYLPDVAATLINLSIFFIQSRPEREMSLQCAREAYACLVPFLPGLPLAQKYRQTVIAIFAHWDEPFNP